MFFLQAKFTTALLCLLVLILAPGTVLAETEDDLQKIEALVQDVNDGVKTQEVLVDYLIEQTIRYKKIPSHILNYPWEDVLELETIFADYLRKQVGRLLIGFPHSEVVPLKDLAFELLDENGEKYKQIEQLFSLSEYAISFRTDGDIEGLASLYDSSDGNIEKEIINKHLVPTIAAFYKANKTPGSAIEVLNRLSTLTEADEDQTIYSLGSQSLFSIAGLIDENPSELVSSWPFDSKDVRSFINKLLIKDSTVKAPLSEIYSWWVIHSVREGDINAAEYFYTKVMVYRSDPSKENNKLRKTIVLEAKTEDAKYFALGRLEELRTEGGVTGGLKVSMLFKGYYGDSLPKGFLITVIIAFSFVIIVYFWGKIKSLPRYEVKEAVESKPETVVPAGMGSLKLGRQKNLRGYEREHGMDEYSKLLAVFDLTDGASEEEIKQAYRQKMKEHHPDHATEQNSDAVKNFREYKKVYDRLIEMRSNFFGTR